MKKIILVASLIVLVGMGLWGYTKTQPNEFRVERSIVINASPDKIFSHIIDFRKWEEWSPWAKMDTNQKNIYSGKQSGVGAIHEWDGNSKVGQGKIEIKKIIPLKKIMLQLDFLKPMKATSFSDFIFSSEKGVQGTRVTWSLYGTNTFISKIISLFMNMDKVAGSQYEEGLSNLKKVVEK